MYRPVACHDLFGGRPGVAAGEVGQFTAGLHQDQTARSDIPRAEVGFDARFKTAAGDIAEFCGGSSHQAGPAGKAV